MWRRVLDRPVRVLGVLLLAGCVVSISAVGWLAWTSRQRLSSIRERVEHANRIQRVGLRAQQSLLVRTEPDAVADPVLVRDLREEVSELRLEGLALDPATDQRLARLELLLDERLAITRERLVAAVALLGEVLAAETGAQERLWEVVDREARFEVRLVIGLMVTVPLLIALAAWLTRHRIVKPLVDLRGLLSELAAGDRRVVPTEGIHPVLLPLFANYNRLVTRLAELEAEHAAYASSLEEKIRAASGALLEQQRTLARAERLAAVGETAAVLAHELRNPLAGIRMSLSNLRAEVDDGGLEQRFETIIAEIDRLGRLVSESLAPVRHTPEESKALDLCELVEGLVSLVRFQIPGRIRLVCEMPAGLECVLPRDRIRQALLNLVLNSVEAIGDDAGEIRVRGRTVDDQVELEVCDSGPGFPPGMLATGIRAFASGGASGTGLGLAIVRRVAQDLGGAITIENVEPRGAIVRMVLPCGHG